jgi:hypothetical protein
LRFLDYSTKPSCAEINPIKEIPKDQYDRSIYTRSFSVKILIPLIKAEIPGQC